MKSRSLFQRLMALALALCLAMSVMPIAFAEEAPAQPPVEAPAETPAETPAEVPPLTVDGGTLVSGNLEGETWSFTVKPDKAGFSSVELYSGAAKVNETDAPAAYAALNAAAPESPATFTYIKWGAPFKVVFTYPAPVAPLVKWHLQLDDTTPIKAMGSVESIVAGQKQYVPATADRLMANPDVTAVVGTNAIFDGWYLMNNDMGDSHGRGIPVGDALNMEDGQE